MAGSRLSGLIAGAMSLGENGYREIVRKLMDTSKKTTAGVHICITLQHVDMTDDFLDDLAAAVTTV
jgi:hypothetical protein